MKSPRNIAALIVAMLVFGGGLWFWLGPGQGPQETESSSHIQQHSDGKPEAPPAHKPVQVVEQPEAEVELVSGEFASVPGDRFFTTTEVVNLQPAAPQDEFKSGDAVYVYAGIHAPRDEHVKIQWIDPNGNALLPTVVKEVQRNTGTTGYRIYTYRILRQRGNYEVRLQNEAGRVIGTTTFSVE